MIRNWQKKVAWICRFWQHLTNIVHFHNLFVFPSWPYYVTLITLYYMGRSEKFKFTVQVYFHVRRFLQPISHRPRHMCQIMTFASGSPRPLAPWSKTIHYILPLCPPCPLQQPSATALRLPSPNHVGICVGAHPVPRRVRGHACLRPPGQQWREADVHTCMHKRESIKLHVKQTQHVRLPLPIMESFHPHWPRG